MKTLENNILLYDQDCPMCKVYSGAFIQSGMLDAQGRMPYHQMTESVRTMVDVARSRNEIALIDTAQQKVIYGLDSLLTILGHNFPIVKTLFRFSPLYWTMKKIYALISYNRKVIAPSRELNPYGACTPDYNVKYRWIFIFISSLFVGFILNLYFARIPFLAKHSQGFATEWLIAAGQLVIQGALVYIYRKDRVLDYLGHNMVISLIGALLLLPAIWFSNMLLNISTTFYTLYFAIPVAVMLWQHIRRVKILELPAVLTVNWVLYRVGIAIMFLLID
ncbi:MAG TPA: hypothetical protein VNB90_17130 [Cytophagaceae bacterium]|jgi:predicted DCC family thiol-disulfide oxidoreductase YuxK|nr:hypothetical protein [Cytophagaceae bacterium]